MESALRHGLVIGTVIGHRFDVLYEVAWDDGATGRYFGHGLDAEGE